MVNASRQTCESTRLRCYIKALISLCVAVVFVTFRSIRWQPSIYTIANKTFTCHSKVSSLVVPVKSHTLKRTSMIITRAAVLNEPDGVLLRLLALQTCPSVTEPIFIQLDEGEVACASTITANGDTCPWDWAKNCEWNMFVLSVVLPKVPRTITVFRGKNAINLDYELVRRKGDLKLAVCIQPLYWYVDWLRIIEFVEAWKSQGADHFFFYYSTVNQQTMNILNHYKSMGLVTLLPWKSFASSREADPNQSVYRLAHTLASNDCLLRTQSARFVAFVDVDELVVVNGKTLYNLLDAKSRKCSRCGGYAISHSKLIYGYPRPTGAFVWQNVTMEWLSQTHASVPDINGPRKMIYIPQRVTAVAIHGPKQLNDNFAAVRLSDSEVVLFHARIDEAKDAIPRSRNLLRDVIPSSLRYRILAAYRNVMRDIGMNVTAFLNWNVHSRVHHCIRRWRKVGCKVPAKCGEKVKNMDRWISADDSNSPDRHQVL